jgi:tRNA-2-methylthio-N6-dimethylallyladenosine synthase
MNESPTIYLETMGCQMNALDSELVLGELLARGYRLTDDLYGAALVVLNTCSVRGHAEDKVYSRLGQLRGARRKKPDQIVAVIGCMAERDADGLLARSAAVDVLCGPSDLHRLPALIADVREKRAPVVALSGWSRDRSTAVRHVTPHDDLESLDRGRAMQLADHAAMPRVFGRHQAYVRITRGCNKHCTFCVVPFTRGPEVHRPPEGILDDVRGLVAAGVIEITLLGQTVNHYNHLDPITGRRTSFAELLRRIHDEVPHLPRLRFITSFPRDFTDDALRVMAESPRLCRYLHLPAQSGSNTVLKRMNRGYTVEQYLALLERARTLMPDIALSGDMIVGFPGETDADFQKSVDLLRAARYKNCYIFKYSPRPGTPAHDRLPDDVPEEVKRRRNNDLLAVQAEINVVNHRELMEKTVEVLVEGPSKKAMRQRESVQDHATAVDWTRAKAGQLVGRTRGDQIVVFDGDPALIGRLVNVTICAATPYTLYGRLTTDATTLRNDARRDLPLAVLATA